MSDWKLKICCDMMEEDRTCGGGVLLQDPYEPRMITFGPKPGNSCQIDYCPWCGRIIEFTRDDAEGEE